MILFPLLLLSLLQSRTNKLCHSCFYSETSMPSNLPTYSALKPSQRLINAPPLFPAHNIQRFPIHLILISLSFLDIVPSSTSTTPGSPSYRSYSFKLMMAGSTSSFLLSSLLLLYVLGLATSDDSLQQKCGQVSTKLLPCIDYANGNKDQPPSDCCTSVKDIRNADPVCLCFVIQQTHSGSSSFRSLGLKVDRLVQLPTVCKLANSSVSDCPKLLNLSPSSPDYSIFTNITAAKNTSSGSADTAHSKAFIHQIRPYGIFATALVTATFLSVLS